MSASFIKKLDMVLSLLNDMCNISLPFGEKLTSLFIFKVVPINLAGRELPVDLIVLEMINYNVILGMDWLSKHNTIIFCKKKIVVFQPFEEGTFKHKGKPRGSKWLVISIMKASIMLTKGCVGYLAGIVNSK